jgi:superoxide dismutase, Fe-Mn family
MTQHTQHTLPALPYGYDALEPWIDEATMRLHHDKHHQAYLDKFLAAVEGSELAEKPVTEVLADLGQVPEKIRTAVRNNGGGFVNHNLFWEVMAPHAGGQPTGALSDALASEFGSFESFVERFSDAAVGQFGSGWAWLVVRKDGGLGMASLPNQDSPLSQGETPILGLDVWEHAYYLKYQNKRADYVKAWWNVVNWKKVSENLGRARR